MDAKDVKHGKIIRKIFNIGPVKNMSYTDESGKEIQRLSFTITSNRKDRDKDIVDPAGAITDDYANNPVMLWAHDYTGLPIGQSVEMTRVEEPQQTKSGDMELKNKIHAIVTFQPDENYQKNWTGITGGMIYKMYSSGFLHAVSIGFDPQEWEAIEEKGEEGKTPAEMIGLNNAGTHFKKWDLLEFSAVPVPSNPDALVDRKSFMKTLKGWAEKTIEECNSCDLKSMEFVESGAIEKPYPNEHACRLKDPSGFEPDSFRRTSRDHNGKKYNVIMGKLKGETSMTEQSYRYPKDIWDAASARTHCADHNGTFEVAVSAEYDGGIDKMIEELDKAIEKAGAVLSTKNKTDLKTASDLILSVLSSAEPTPAAPAGPEKPAASAEVTTSYPLGHEAMSIIAKELAKELAEDEGSEKKSEDIIPTVDDGKEPEIFVIDEEDLKEALEHFGLAQEQGETQEE